MHAKLDADIQKLLEEAGHEESEIPVIITLEPETDPSALIELGLQVENAFESISAVSGKIPLKAIPDAAELVNVKRIEYDGTMQAMD